MSSWSQNRIRSLYGLKLLAIALILGLLGAGCSGSKSLSKKAAKLEEAGLYSDAAQFYYNSLLRNNSNVDARIGLTKTGQRVLNDKMDEFSRARNLGETKKAVYLYREGLSFYEKVKKLGISLEYPSYFDEDYAEVKDTYIRKLYDEGNALMAEKKFEDAKRRFKEIETLEPGYEDIAELKSVARNEPIYIKASEYFDSQKYRLAFYELDKIYREDASYRDVSILRDECLNLGKFPIAVIPFENNTNEDGLADRVNAFVVTALSNLDDPFLKIVERENMNIILNEQRINLSGIVDESTAAQVGNLLGARAVLTGKVLSYNPRQGRVKVTEKQGYEAYRVKLYNKEEDEYYYKTRYKPVKYREYYNENRVELSFQYKVISLETGEVLISEIIEDKMEDQVYYATYDGEITQLYPAGPNGVLNSRRDQRRVLDLIRADRSLKSVETLTNEVYQDISRRVSTDLVNLMHSE